MTDAWHKDDVVALELMIHMDTDDGVLVSVNGIRADAVWLGKSVCDFEEPIIWNKAQIIAVQTWAAKKRGLI